MISEIVVHIGMEKTGSSSIQHSFRDYDDGALIYAPFEWVNHSLPLQVMFKPLKQQSPGFQSQGLSEAEFTDMRDRARKQIEDAFRLDRQKMVISAEGALSLNERQHRKMRDFLLAHCDTLRLMAYVREPLNYAASSFQQGLKTGQKEFKIPAQHFEKRMGRIFEVYGMDRVELIRFNPKTFPENSVVKDFGARIGAKSRLLEEQRANDSMAMYAAAALFLWNREGMVSVGTKDKFQARIQLTRHLLQNSQKRKSANALWAQMGGNALATDERGVRKFRFSDDLVRAHIQADDVAWMESKLGAELMPGPRKAEGETAEYGITSEEDFLALGEAAYPWLSPLLKQYRLKSPAQSTVSALDTLYAFLLDRIESKSVKAT